MYCRSLYHSQARIREIRAWEKVHVQSEKRWALHPEDRGLLGRYCQVDSLPSRILSAYMWEWPVQILIVVVYLAIALGAAAPGCPA